MEPDSEQIELNVEGEVGQEQDHESGNSDRIRTLTEKGQALFEANKDNYLNTLKKQWTYIQQTFRNPTMLTGDLKELNNSLRELKGCQTKFLRTSKEP